MMRSFLRDPIAVIGMACRFPGGVDGTESFWRLLDGGVDATSEIPASRFDPAGFYDPDRDRPGAIYTRRGGFLDQDIRLFDNGFFGISPLEAEFMDPQFRLVLELSLETLEDAGQNVERLRGSDTGVYIGVCFTEYKDRILYAPGAQGINAYLISGNTACSASGRISHAFGFEGPSLSMDAACSSSLLTVHTACRDLWAGETDLALAGGVSLLLTPENFIAFCKLKVLSPEGRSKGFDAAADGYARAEGAGLVCLKRLADALRDGDRIYALIPGTALTNDGASYSYTAPRGEAQEKTIRKALAQAGLGVDDIGYIETHGAGTRLGDRIEMTALGNVFRDRSPDRPPLVVGAVKSNIGHAEAASGVASLIKTVLCVHRGRFVPHLHFRRPNPEIDWNIPVRVGVESAPWCEAEGRRRVAGIDSFGMSGVNVHVLVAEHRPGSEPPARGQARKDVHLLSVGARTPKAVEALGRAWLARLETADGADGELGRLCAANAHRRADYEYRLAVAGRDAAELRRSLAARLEALAADPPPNARRELRLAFAYPGQGGHYPGMGRELYAAEPVFRRALDRCLDALGPYAAFDARAELLAGGDPERLTDPAVIQPLLFALQVALAELWQAWGVAPDAVVGHSVGEVAAAHTAGILDLEQAARLICLRGWLAAGLRGSGGMLVVGLGEAELAARLDGRQGVWVAVRNAPRSTVLSGRAEVLETLRATLEADDVFARRVQVDFPSHCPLMDAAAAQLQAELTGFKPAAGHIPLISTVLGAALDGRGMDAAYWAANLRRTVRFTDAVQGLVADGVNLFLEVGPHPVTLFNILETAREAGGEIAALPTLRRDAPELTCLAASRAALHEQGLSVAWEDFYHAAGTGGVALPRYPLQGQVFWIETAPRQAADAAAGTGQGQAGTPAGPRQEPAPAPEPPPQPSQPAAPRAADRAVDRKAVLARLREMLAEALKMPAAEIDADAPLAGLGFDSLMAMRLKSRLDAEYGLALSPTSFWNYPTPRGLAGHVAACCARAAEGPAGVPARNDAANDAGRAPPPAAPQGQDIEAAVAAMGLDQVEAELDLALEGLL